MADQNRRLVLAQRPTGMVDDDVVRLETTAVPAPGPGEAVVKVSHLSIDPTIRTWMDDAPGYLPPIEIDAVIRSGGSGPSSPPRTTTSPSGRRSSGCWAGRTTACWTTRPAPARWCPTAWTPPRSSACSA
ncbi:hypothetical protein ACE2AJ_19430 [Aquihabitans daechungensis]|uniref:hypothetical protein n=1 Tax=Aquihabitans daechungensis TaxID=1052257 RepID=UPI003BA1BF78